jgi:translation initiation factor 2 alpha subunit (eIF-2alpha)
MEFEYGDLVLCTVEKIEKTIVFVRIEGNGEGSIMMSEIAPGRIRNVRDYVVPRKKIVCKVLRVSQKGNVELSLRRVTPKERKEVIAKYKQEKNYKNLLKSILGDKHKEIIEKITKKERLYDFFEEAKKDPKKLEKLFGDNATKILEIISSQKKKTIIVKREISLQTSQPNGLELIKNILGKIDADVKYISAGKYSIKTEAEDAKTADKKISQIASDVEKKSKSLKVEFSISEK